MEFGRYGDGAAQESAVCYRVPSALHQEQCDSIEYQDVERCGAQRPGQLSSREAD